MQYKDRELEKKFLEASGFFKVVLLIGARQVGKSTMLKHLAAQTDRTIVTMDDDFARDLARTDPVLFFQTYKPPILIDEIQKAPELMERIKIMVDDSEERGRFWLIGSQRSKLLEKSQDSLAGRIGILHLYGLSQREKAGVLHPAPLDYTMKTLKERHDRMGQNDIHKVYEHIIRGGYADVQNAGKMQRNLYYQSYIDNYLMSDAINEAGIKDTEGFKKFIRACAAMIGNLVNYNTLAEAAGISKATAKKWLGILKDMEVIYLLEPYANNELKRIVKAPKLYFCDTGLCAYLARWNTVESLMDGAASGHYYENYVVMELIKNYAYAEDEAALSFYRDDNMKEVDIFVEENGRIHPLEIKKSANPDKKEVKKFSVIDKTSLQHSTGGIICMYPEPFPIDTDNSIIPSNLI